MDTQAQIHARSKMCMQLFPNCLSNEIYLSKARRASWRLASCKTAERTNRGSGNHDSEIELRRIKMSLPKQPYPLMPLVIMCSLHEVTYWPAATLEKSFNLQPCWSLRHLPAYNLLNVNKEDQYSNQKHTNDHCFYSWTSVWHLITNNVTRLWQDHADRAVQYASNKFLLVLCQLNGNEACLTYYKDRLLRGIACWVY